MSSKGISSSGARFARGALYALIGNPLYIGEIAHKCARFPGQHEPIIDREIWEAVQQQLRSQGARRRGTSGDGTSAPLLGKLFDEAGEQLTPTYAIKKGRRYSYYVSRSAGGPPAEVLIGSTAVKAHRCASGGKGGNSRRRSAVPAAGGRRKSTR